MQLLSTPTNAQAFIGFAILIAGFLLIGKALLYIADLYNWKTDMKEYRKYPQASPPPKKPTFFKSYKQ